MKTIAAFCLIFVLLLSSITFAQEPVTLHFWTRLGDNPQVAAVVDEWNAANPDIQVELQGIPGDDYRTRLLTAVAGGQTPDIVGMDTPLMPQYVELDAIRPIDDLVPEELLADFPEGLLQSNYGDDGQLYGVPWWSDPSAMWVNLALFEEAGVAPETWDDLREASAAITNLTGDPATDVYGAIIPVVGPWVNWVWLPYFWGNGGELLDADNCSTFDSPAAIEAMQLWVDMFQAGEVPRSAVFGDSATINAIFFNDRAGMTLNGPGLFAAALTVNPDIRLGSVPMPRSDDGNHSSFLGGDNLVIMNSSEHPEEAWQFIEFMIDAERMAALADANNSQYISGLMTRNSAFTDDYLEKYPFHSGFFEALQVGRTPDTIYQTEVRNPVYNNFQAALDGQITTEEAAAIAAQQINEITGCTS
jgi:multiple sugar transport system substrate-binding protein